MFLREVSSDLHAVQNKMHCGIQRLRETTSEHYLTCLRSQNGSSYVVLLHGKFEWVEDERDKIGRVNVRHFLLNWLLKKIFSL